MDHRGWPWKKKSINKTGIQKALDAADPASSSLASVASLQDQGNCKKINYIQIPLDSYTHLTGLENEVKDWQSKVKDLEEQLSASNLEITAKENIAAQHSKVAEEAVSGWEKADAEASALNTQLESVKECLRQLRVAKKEHDEKMNEIIFNKNKQCEKIKTDLEAKIAKFEEKLLRSAAENASLSRSLQEHYNMLMKINDEKSQVDKENELLKQDIQLYEKEINSLKYEVHVVSKELDIRNEEKNMSIRSAEAANEQYLDSAKKIIKLEAECQKLRGFVKKKLPGPAAVAQMKLEVENWNKKSHTPSLPDIYSDNTRLDYKESEILMKRLFDMEEENEMLKQALVTQNGELQSSRELCDKISGRIKILETQVQILNERKTSPISVLGSSSKIASNPQSVTSLSEDGFDDDGRYSDSPTISDVSNIKKDKIRIRSNNPIIGTSLDFMDDFLEMEKIAHVKDNSEKSFDTEGSHFNDVTKSQICVEGTAETEILSPENSEIGNSKHERLGDQDLVNIVSAISQFITCLKRIIIPAHDSSTVGLMLIKEYEELSASLDKIISREFSLVDIFLSLSRILAHVGDLELFNNPIQELNSQLAEARSELASSRKNNGLAETQLKCMAESYKLLETRAQELEENVKILEEKLENLDATLQEEKCGHEEALARSKDLQEQISRKESCQACSSLTADSDVKIKKEREIEDAAAKLAECQETIFLLGKQFKSLHRPQTELNESHFKEKLQSNETAEYKLSQSFRSPQIRDYSHDFEAEELGRASSFDMRGVFDKNNQNEFTRFYSPKGKH